MSENIHSRIRQHLTSILRCPEAYGGAEAFSCQVLLLLDLLSDHNLIHKWNAYERRVCPDKPSSIPLWDWIQSKGPLPDSEKTSLEHIWHHMLAFTAEQDSTLLIEIIESGRS